MGEVYQRKSERVFSGLDLDIDQLNIALDQLSEKIEHPYIERRNMGADTDPLDELKNAIREIKEREEELKQ